MIAHKWLSNIYHLTIQVFCEHELPMQLFFLRNSEDVDQDENEDEK